VQKLVVLASGSGTNFQAIINSIKDGSIKGAAIVALIVNKSDIKVIERAKEHNIPIYILESDFENNLRIILERLNPDLIVLAGFLKKIPSAVIKKYPDKIINIHPSLLPKYGGKGFYGMKVHEAVIDAGDEVSGCTVHFVNEIYDAGKIIDQKTVPVKSDDTPETLAARILKQEHLLYPKVIQKLLNDKN